MLSEKFSVQQLAGDTVSRTPKANTGVVWAGMAGVRLPLPVPLHWLVSIDRLEFLSNKKKSNPGSQLLQEKQEDAKRHWWVIDFDTTGRLSPRAGGWDCSSNGEALWDYLLPRPLAEDLASSTSGKAWYRKQRPFRQQLTLAFENSHSVSWW